MRIFSIGEDDLNEGELEQIQDLDPDIVIYEYEAGEYEGNGDLLIHKDGLWSIHDLSHCSCNGPTDFLSVVDPVSTLSELKSQISDSRWDTMKRCLDKAKELGFD